MAAQLTPLIAQSWSLATALSLLVLSIFTPQCISTLVAVRRETNSWRYLLLVTVYLFALAYLASWVAYRLAVMWTGGDVDQNWVVGLMVALTACTACGTCCPVRRASVWGASTVRWAVRAVAARPVTVVANVWARLLLRRKLPIRRIRFPFTTRTE